MRTRRLIALVLLLAALPAARAPAVHADADPPSDLLLGTSVYYPYSPQVAPALQRTLNRAVTELARTGLKLKVAIVATKIDLGAIPDLFGRPQTYARFLDQEISLNGPQPLLTVMPQGFGIVHAGSPAALAGVAVDSAHQSNGLARSAILAVVAIARARGDRIDPGPIPSPTGALGGGGSGIDAAAIAAGAAAALAFLGLAGWLARRRRSRRLSFGEP